jgi:purine-binding chemotaxis protein CheW
MPEEVQLVVFKLGEEEYGVDVSQVREIVKLMPITRIPRAPSFVEGVINLRGQITTIIDLRKRFGVEKSGGDESRCIMVTELESNVVGMIVDSVSEVLRLPTENIDPTPPMVMTKISADFLKGVGKLDGRLIILLDLGRILTEEEVSQLESKL